MRQSSGVVAVEPRRGRGRGFRIEVICGEVGDKLEGGEGVVGPGEWELLLERVDEGSVSVGSMGGRCWSSSWWWHLEKDIEARVTVGGGGGVGGSHNLRLSGGVGHLGRYESCCEVELRRSDTNHPCQCRKRRNNAAWCC